MGADDLLRRLEGVQGRGPTWRAVCPAHESRHRSKTLAIRAESDGRVLLHCFAGCSIEQIVGVLGIELQDLFPPRVDDEKRAPRARRPWSAHEVVRALLPEITGAWALLRKIRRGNPITAQEREYAGRVANRCEALLQELAE